tara:strand:+ start:79 stop:981 length:903 start_codon:yes stop_codon:yes gene_type:complete
MNVINVKGGLGNQMFQYAFFLSHLIKNEETKLEITNFQDYYSHNGLELCAVFGINLANNVYKGASKSSKDTFPFFKLRKWIGQIFLNKNLFIKQSHYIEENYSHFDLTIYQKKDAYLDGYWQNEKYFINIRSEILSKYKWLTISKRNELLASKMSSENSIAVHIRRFDKIKKASDIIYFLRLILTYRITPKSYYSRAIQLIKNSVPNPKFYIFTNNVKWVQNNFNEDVSFTFVDWNKGLKSNEDMFLMSKCKHNIISASTFSWWGAWLNPNRGKIVVAPKKWASRLEIDRGIVPKNWKRI